jgi:peptidoglycan-associated lipoprotein
MKQQTLLAVGLAGFLSIAACSKHVAAGARPLPPVPVAAAAVNPTPAPPTRTSPVSVASTRQPAAASRPSTITPQERITLNERLARMEDALFDYDRATIRTDATVVLKDDVNVVRGILANYPAQKLVIQGNADDRGSEEYNLALGDKRAHAAEEFLTSMGIPEVQLTVISYGKERPVCTEETESCWQRNRRAHITAAP